MKTTRLIHTWGLVCGLLLLSSGWAAGQEPGKERNETLFLRLGGMRAIQLVVDDFTFRVLDDERVSGYFARAMDTPQRRADYKTKLVAFVCQAAGGPCKYTGKDLIAAHAGRGINDAAFKAVMESLDATLDSFHVPEREKQQLRALMTQVKAQVVEPRP
ncbi:MAG: group 1 truncated hemoglobin [Acidobacteria bacterium]|nr:group 1 truncated hemoglobin [Acidobacteriota bacterium]